MTALKEFRCEICGLITSTPVRWFVIRCGQSELSVVRWSDEAAHAVDARHFCGEGHAQIYISRWFESVCTPAKPDFNLPSKRMSAD